MDVYKSILKFCRSHGDLEIELSQWEGQLSRLLESHPELVNSGEGNGGSSDEDDSQGLDCQELSDVPSSLPSEGVVLTLSLSMLLTPVAGLVQ